jgi:type IV secretory pathway TraG/TraD family ATPase VirD4
MLHLIEADVKAGLPVVVIDPKRDLIDEVLGRIPAHRVEDVVVLDLADSQPIGFNPLDAASRRPEVVADGVVAALRAVFADSWGPRTEDVFYCSILSLTIAGQRRSQPYTLVDVAQLLTDPAFRRTVVGSLGNDAMLASFWGSYESLGEAAQAQVLAAPMNKLRQYLRSQLRQVLDQARSPFRMSDMFVSRQILLVPLNEGLVGPISAALLGSLLVAELWQSILARANEHLPVDRPAMVYIDEAQRFIHLPTSLEDALSRSRSLGVGWHLAHQSRSQLGAGLREAIDANARNKIVFGLSSHDANQMAKQAQELEAEDFMALGQFQAYVRPVVSGHPAAWCSVKTLPPSERFSSPTAIRAASAMKFRTDIEADASAAQVNENPTSTPVGRKRRTS